MRELHFSFIIHSSSEKALAYFSTLREANSRKFAGGEEKKEKVVRSCHKLQLVWYKLCEL